MYAGRMPTRTTGRHAVSGLLILAVAVVGFWLFPSTEPGIVDAGSVDEVRSHGVVYVRDHTVFVVADGDGFLALGADSRHVGERVLFCPVDGTFVSPAHGERFDRAGRYLAGPAAGDLARYPAGAVDGRVLVDVAADPQLPARSSPERSWVSPTCGDATSGTENPPGFMAPAAGDDGNEDLGPVPALPPVSTHRAG